MKIQVLQEKDPPAKISKLFSFQIRIQGEGRGGGQRGRCHLPRIKKTRMEKGKQSEEKEKRE